MSSTQKCRILNIYLRPWTLVKQLASAHVPYILDLDVVVTSALIPLRRHTVKKPRTTGLQRSMVDAWKDYSRYHIVSKHALRLIRNFTLTQMPETVEAHEDDVDEDAPGRSKLAEVASPWATSENIASWIDGLHTSDELVTTKLKKTTSISRQTTHQLWGVGEDADDAPTQISKDGSIAFHVKSNATTTSTSNTRESTEDTDGTVVLQYKGLTKATANAWFATLCRRGSARDKRDPKAIPHAEQQIVIRRIIDRCLTEMEDE